MSLPRSLGFRMLMFYKYAAPSNAGKSLADTRTQIFFQPDEGVFKDSSVIREQKNPAWRLTCNLMVA